MRYYHIEYRAKNDFISLRKLVILKAVSECDAKQKLLELVKGFYHSCDIDHVELAYNVAV